MRCPCCKAAVHETAFHRIDPKTTFVVGETVLKWDMATAALQKQSNPTLARIEVGPMGAGMLRLWSSNPSPPELPDLAAKCVAGRGAGLQRQHHLRRHWQRMHRVHGVAA